MLVAPTALQGPAVKAAPVSLLVAATSAAKSLLEAYESSPDLQDCPTAKMHAVGAGLG